MQGPSHLMLSWYLAEAARVATPRDRRIVAWAGFAPDVDVLLYAGAIVYYGLDRDLAFENVWKVVHHRYTHGLGFVVVTAFVAWLLASRHAPGSAPARTVVFAAAASALHCFFDLVGGGPTWPIFPFWPVSDFAWSVSWSYTIGEWPNVAILFACLAGMILYARRVGRSPIECFGDRANRWFVGVVRNEAAGAAADERGRNRRRTLVRIAIWGGLALVVAAILAPLGLDFFR